MVATGGLEPPLDRLSTCCLCPIGLHGHGPSGWTRTTTARVKSPACCIDTTEGMELIPGIEPGRRSYQGRRLPLHQISIGANGGIRTRTSRLGRPAGNRYPTFASGSAYGYRTRPSTLAAWDAPSTLRPNMDRCRSPAHRHLSIVKEPALASWWAARDSNPNAPRGRTGLRPVSGPSARTARIGDSARPRTWTREFWRLGCFRLHHAADLDSRCDRFEDKTSLRPDAGFFPASGQNKKGLLGDRPRRPGSQ
jgi:hypothetical protein